MPIQSRIAFALLLANCLFSTLLAQTPGTPQNLAATVTGNTVTFTWQAPSVGGIPTSYQLEASLSPGGALIATLPVSSSPATVPNVPNGVYYVRVRALNADGPSAQSNEVVVAVPSGATTCTAPPAAPTGLSGNAVGTLVSIVWAPAASGCVPTAYVLQAGSAPGLSNIALVNVGAATSLSASAPSGTYYIRVLALNAFGSSAATADVVVTVGTPTSIPPPTLVPPAGVSFGPGQWLVNTQVAPGRYYSDPVSGCYWERQRGLTGSINDVIANEFIGFDARQWIVDIASTDLAFETDGQCGTWFNTPRHGFQGSEIPPGMWLVGSQIAAGTYAVSAGSGCYWERLRGFSGNFADIIDNEFVSGASQQLITILSTDVGFNNDADCGTWTRINDTRIMPDRGGTSVSQIERNWRSNQQ